MLQAHYLTNSRSFLSQIYEIITACSSITPDGTSLFDSSAPDLLVWDRFSPARATMVTSDGVKEVLGLSREVWDLCARTLNLVKRWDRFRETSEPGTWQEAEIRKLAGELDMELRERDDDSNKSSEHVHLSSRPFYVLTSSQQSPLEHSTPSSDPPCVSSSSERSLPCQRTMSNSRRSSGPRSSILNLCRSGQK